MNWHFLSLLNIFKCIVLVLFMSSSFSSSFLKGGWDGEYRNNLIEAFWTETNGFSFLLMIVEGSTCIEWLKCKIKRNDCRR